MINISLAILACGTLQGLAYAASNSSQSGNFTSSLVENTADYYLGYKDDDFNGPWAHFWNPTIAPLSDDFADGLLKSPHAAEYGVSFEDAPDGKWIHYLADGSLKIAIRSEPKYITGDMLDWWFHWHMNSTTKYKLWNPSAHRYSGVMPSGLTTDEVAQLSYRKRLWNGTSFINEYIGQTATTLSIGFFDASPLNFTIGNATSETYSSLNPAIANNIETLIYATSALGFAIQNPDEKVIDLKTFFSNSSALLMHQLRQKPDGSGEREMRSRFWFGTAFVAEIEKMVSIDIYAKALATHCHIEMTHLGELLPGFFYEFKDDIYTS